MTTVLLALRDATLAAQWREELQADGRWRVPPASQSFAELRVQLARHQPLLLLADLRLADGNLVSLVQALRSGARHRHLPVLAVAGDDQDPLLLDVLQAGADSFCQVPTPRPGSVRERVDDTLSGGAVIAPWIAGRLLDHFGVQRPVPGARVPVEELVNPLSLNPAEHQMLRQLSAGLSLNDLASVEGVSARTLTARVRTIYRKMQWALRAGDLSLA